jgi:hypothetical protein
MERLFEARRLRILREFAYFDREFAAVLRHIAKILICMAGNGRDRLQSSEWSSEPRHE